MLRKIIDRFAAKNNPARCRRTRAAILFAYLEEHHSLTLDRDGLALVGMSRKQAFQTVYDLVLHEKIQIRAEEDGKVVAMSNAEFIRLMEQRAKETWQDEAGLELAGREGAGAFDIAFAAEEGAEISAGGRQTLPDRRREPWIEFEDYPIETD